MGRGCTHTQVALTLTQLQHPPPSTTTRYVAAAVPQMADDLSKDEEFEKWIKPTISDRAKAAMLRRQLLSYRAFSGASVMANTSVLWGRGIVQTACSATGALALNKFGEVFAWGGKNQWWGAADAVHNDNIVQVYHRIDPKHAHEPPDVLTNKERRRNKGAGGGGTDKPQRRRSSTGGGGGGGGEQPPGVAVQAGPADDSDSDAESQGSLDTDEGEPSPTKSLHRVTPRSALVMTNTAAGVWRGKTLAQLKEEKRQQRLAAAHERADRIKAVAQYFGTFVPPPHHKRRLKHADKIVLPGIPHWISESLDMRGDTKGSSTARNKSDMVERFYEVLCVEKAKLTPEERAHIRKLDMDYRDYFDHKDFARSTKLRRALQKAWKPLLPALEEYRELERQRHKREEVAKQREQDAAFKLYNARFNMVTNAVASTWDKPEPETTPRGQHTIVHVGGLTPRGPPMSSPRGLERIFYIAAGAHHAAIVHRTAGLLTWGLGQSGRLGHGGLEDESRPRVVESLQNLACSMVSCGRTHTAALTAGGHLYTWGSAALGQLGIDVGSSDVEMSFIDGLQQVHTGLAAAFRGTPFLPLPHRVQIPSVRSIAKVSCGYSHTAAVTSDGHVYVWGDSGMGRLGLGPKVSGNVATPTLVKSLARQRFDIVDVSCGCTHTVVLTRYHPISLTALVYAKPKPTGGKVLVAGSRWVLGKRYATFSSLPALDGLFCDRIAAGKRHTAVKTVEGEVWTWGFNENACTGHSPDRHFIEHPERVKCLYVKPGNLAQFGTAEHSSTFNSRRAFLGNNGDTLGLGEERCTHTLLEDEPWWQLDLGQRATVVEIRLHNRQDIGITSRFDPPDMYSKRLFPCHVMLSVVPMMTDTKNPLSHGVGSLERALKRAAFTKRFGRNQRETVWKLPAGAVGRYVRVQLEGRQYLHLAEVEVIGHFHEVNVMRPVSEIAAGDNVTIAVVPPDPDADNYERTYLRAIAADPANALILRGLPAFTASFEKCGASLQQCVQ